MFFCPNLNLLRTAEQKARHSLPSPLSPSLFTKQRNRKETFEIPQTKGQPRDNRFITHDLKCIPNTNHIWEQKTTIEPNNLQRHDLHPLSSRFLLLTHAYCISLMMAFHAETLLYIAKSFHSRFSAVSILKSRGKPFSNIFTSFFFLLFVVSPSWECTSGDWPRLPTAANSSIIVHALFTRFRFYFVLLHGWRVRSGRLWQVSRELERQFINSVILYDKISNNLSWNEKNKRFFTSAKWLLKTRMS